MLALMPRSA